MRKRFIIGITVLVMVLVGIVILSTIPRPEAPPKPTPVPTATPVPTEVPATVVKVLGGQVFLANPKVVDHLLNEYNLKVEFVSSGSFDMAKKTDEELKAFDAIWPGSAAAIDLFQSSHPGLIRKSATVFSTPTMFFTWAKYRDTLIKSGIVYQEDGSFYMRADKVVAAMNANESWSSLGVNIPGPVNFRYTDPLRSGGGLAYLGWLAAVQTASDPANVRPVELSQLEGILPSLLNSWEMQGRQDTSSPEAFEIWAQTGPGMPFCASSESLAITLFNNVADKSSLDQILGIYSEVSVRTEHVLAGLSPAGIRLVEIFSTDAELKRIGWEDHGMRTGAGTIGAKAGDTSLSWIAASPKLIISEPKKEVTDRIQAAIKAQAQ